MTVPRNTALATDLLKRVADAAGEELANRPSTDRDQAVEALRAAIVARSRVRRARGFVIGGLALAASVLVGVAGAHLARSFTAKSGDDVARLQSIDGRGTLVGRDGAAHPLASEAFGLGATVVTAAGGGARWTYRTGTEVELGEQTRLRVASMGASNILALEQGTFHARVSKLHAGERFVVQTPDAEVEVRGTQFDVSLAPPEPNCGEGTTTRLVVREGVVVVRRDGTQVAAVRAGESWPTCTPPPPAPVPAVSALPASALPAASGARAANASRPAFAENAGGIAARSARPASTLAEQNAAFDRALDASRRGQDSRAAAELEDLFERYPNGPLAESAEIERMRILSRIDLARGKQAARAYLERHHRGAGAADAQRILARPEP